MHNISNRKKPTTEANIKGNVRNDELEKGGTPQRQRRQEPCNTQEPIRTDIGKQNETATGLGPTAKAITCEEHQL